MNLDKLSADIQSLSARLDRLEAKEGTPPVQLEAEPNWNRMLENLRNKLQMSAGPIDQGNKDNRNRLGTGSKKYWNTYPGDIYVQPNSPTEKDFGTITFHFSGRERVEDYVAFSLRDTNDNNYSGKVTATYEFTRRGNVYIDQVLKHGGTGRIGDAVVTHVAALDGDSVG